MAVNVFFNDESDNFSDVEDFLMNKLQVGNTNFIREVPMANFTPENDRDLPGD